MKELLDRIISVEGVQGIVVVKADDGARVDGAGETSSLLDDVSAFVGSCGDVISKLLKLNGFGNLKFYTKNAQYLIIPKEDTYLGVRLRNSENTDNTIGEVMHIVTGKQKVTEIPEVEKTPPVEEQKSDESGAEEEESVLNLSPNIKKFIESKVLQINYLINEFAEGGNKDDWLQNVIYSLKTMDKERKMSEALIERNNKVELYIDKVSNDISENEISTISKGIIDELCKLAVRRFGTDQTKQKIQNVIKRITKSRVG